MSPADGGSSQPFAFLADHPPPVIAAYLKTETDNVAGLVLAQSPPALAAKIMANFTAERQRKLVPAIRRARRIPAERLSRIALAVHRKLEAAEATANTAVKKNAPPSAGPAPAKAKGFQSWRPRRDDGVRPVNAPRKEQTDSDRQRALQRALTLARDKAAALDHRRPRARRPSAPGSATGGGGRRRINGPAVAAEILRLAPPEVRRNVREHEPRLYQALRKRMFVFEDLAASPQTALGAIFTLADAKAAALALRFASPRLQERALEAVSERRRALLREEMELALGGKERVRIRDVESAQQRVLEIALALQQAGRIVIDPEDPDLTDKTGSDNVQP